MSSSNPGQRFQDMIDNIDWVMDDTKDLTFEMFENSRQVQDAVMFCFLRLSEAARKLDDTTKQLAPDQPWEEIRGIGNILRHGYDEIDLHVIWHTIKHELQPLRDACVQAQEKLSE